MSVRKLTELLRFEPPEEIISKAKEVTDCAGINPIEAISLLQKIRDRHFPCQQPAMLGFDQIDQNLVGWRTACFELPAETLSQYEADRRESLLARILARTKRMMAVADRVVVLGLDGHCMGARALLDSCCQPYFNDLSRGQRGSRPRLYFIDKYLENDSAQGLLHMLRADRPASPKSVEESWALVVMGDNGDSIEGQLALSKLLDALEASCGGDKEKVSERFIAVASGTLREFVSKKGFSDIFPVPSGIPCHLSVMSAVGLVPAALMGINVMWLLTGAARMYEHFLREKHWENMIFSFATVNYWMESQQQVSTRLFRIWSPSLQRVTHWYDELLMQVLGVMRPTLFSLDDWRQGKEFESELNPLLARMSYLEGKGVIHNFFPEKYRFDSLHVTDPGQAVCRGEPSERESLPELNKLAIERFQISANKAGFMTSHLVFPRIDEYFMGQFFQMLTLATVLEGQLKQLLPIDNHEWNSTKRVPTQLPDVEDEERGSQCQYN